MTAFHRAFFRQSLVVPAFLLMLGLLCGLCIVPASADEPVKGDSAAAFRPDEVRWIEWEARPEPLQRPNTPKAALPAAPRASSSNLTPPPLGKVATAIFGAASPPAWDVRIRERGWITREGNLWQMWYTGYDGTREGIRRLGTAMSAEGLHWTRYPGNPLISDLWVEDIMLVQRGEERFMFAEGLKDRAQLLYSTDGLHWTPRGTLDVRQTNGQPISEGPYGTPTGWYEDATWYLFYERRDLGIWLAKSTDLKTWTNVRDEPIMIPGPGEYDREALALNQIIKLGDRYYAVLHGTGSQQAPRLWTTYFAYSNDLLQWTKADRSPVFPAAENKSSGQLVHDGREWRLYTHHDRLQVHFAR